MNISFRDIRGREIDCNTALGKRRPADRRRQRAGGDRGPAGAESEPRRRRPAGVRRRSGARSAAQGQKDQPSPLVPRDHAQADRTEKAAHHSAVMWPGQGGP